MSTKSADGGKLEETSKVQMYSEKKDSLEHVEDWDGNGRNREFDDSIEETTPSRAVWLITFTVAMGGFLFGRSRRLCKS